MFGAQKVNQRATVYDYQIGKKIENQTKLNFDDSEDNASTPSWRSIDYPTIDSKVNVVDSSCLGSFEGCESAILENHKLIDDTMFKLARFELMDSDNWRETNMNSFYSHPVAMYLEKYD